MQNRRDQVQAHAFVVGRLVSALLRAEPDAPMTPLRRFVVGTFWGALLGALAVAGFGVYGFISPGGSTAWRAGGALIVEKETGARYVFVEGELRPVVNYASARKGSFKKALATELKEAAMGQGNAIKKRDDTHKMAQANRAFAHFRF